MADHTNYPRFCGSWFCIAALVSVAALTIACEEVAVDCQLTIWSINQRRESRPFPGTESEARAEHCSQLGLSASDLRRCEQGSNAADGSWGVVLECNIGSRGGPTAPTNN